MFSPRRHLSRPTVLACQGSKKYLSIFAPAGRFLRPRKPHRRLRKNRTVSISNDGPRPSLAETSRTQPPDDKLLLNGPGGTTSPEQVVAYVEWLFLFGISRHLAQSRSFGRPGVVLPRNRLENAPSGALLLTEICKAFKDDAPCTTRPTLPRHRLRQGRHLIDTERHWYDATKFLTELGRATIPKRMARC